MATCMDPFHDYGPGLLPQKKSCDQEDIGVPGESDPREQPQGNNKGNRNMYGKDPLQGKSPDVCPPVSERDIQYKYKDGDENKLCHVPASKIRIFRRYVFSSFYAIP